MAGEDKRQLGGGKVKSMRWAMLGALALWLGAVGDAGALQLQAPPDGAAVAGDTVWVVGSGAGSAGVEWSVEGAGGEERGTVKLYTSGSFGVAVPLAPGENRVRVGGRELRVFSSRGRLDVPSGFQSLRVHAGDISQCRDCHKTGYALLAGGYPGVCLNCHVVEAQNPEFRGDALDDRHFRSSGAKCGKCHQPHGSFDRKLLRGTSAELCGGCHGMWEGAEEVHPAYEEGGCVACHDPHFSGYPQQLKSTTQAVCGECHEQGGDSAHEPVTDADACANCHDVHGQGGAMTPRTAPALCVECHDHVLQEGHADELEDCAACHSVHGEGGMLQAGVSEACSECHDDVAEHEVLHAALDEGCESCHSPHRDDNRARAWQGCTECHDMGDGELASLHGGLDLAPGACAACHLPHGAPRSGLLDGELHFPLTQGKCTACHAANARGEALGAVDAGSCRMCHPFEKQLRAMEAQIHDPVAEGDCAACHEPHLGQHAALLRAPQQELCGECHEQAEVESGQSAHSALEACSDCHEAHGSANAHLLTAADGAEQCLECHDDPSAEGEVVHAALDDGCLTCHSPHAGYAPGNLLAPEQESCGECHEEAEVASGQSAHSALEACSDCHEAHAGDHAQLLIAADGSEQCLECHDDPSAESEVVHAALDDGCLTCHSPHAGHAPGNLLGAERGVCLECHDDPAESDDHPEVGADETCSDCHLPHAAEQSGLLR